MRSRLSGKKLKSVLRYRTVASEDPVEAKTFWLTDIQRQSEEEPIDCPDCYDTMVRFYDWDDIRYRCENCDLTLKSNGNSMGNEFRFQQS